MKRVTKHFLRIMIGLAFVNSTISYAKSHYQTEVNVLKPWEMMQESIDPRFTAIQTLKGNCWTASTVNPRPDAWRCMIGNQILDPCFSANPTAKQVACAASPLNKQLKLLTLEKPLPLSQANPDGFLSKNPWMIELNDGQICYPLGGATMGFAGLRNNYSCGKNLIFGAVDCRSSKCRVLYYKEGAISLSYVGIKSIWY